MSRRRQAVWRTVLSHDRLVGDGTEHVSRASSPSFVESVSAASTVDTASINSESVTSMKSDGGEAVRTFFASLAADDDCEDAQAKKQSQVTLGYSSSYRERGAVSRWKRVRVGVRCRPASTDACDDGNSLEEGGRGCRQVVHLEGKSVEVDCGKARSKTFLLDQTFGPDSTQQDVYDNFVRPVVSDVLEGYNGSVLAYGQTGTGKTYTMGTLEPLGQTPSSSDGIVPNALRQIFEEMGRFSCSPACGCRWRVSLSFLQLYLEHLQDLLAPLGGRETADQSLTMREDPSKGFYVQNLPSYDVSSVSEAFALINLGLENRLIACTQLNTCSSRSHTILTIQLDLQPCPHNARFGPHAIESRLRLVDLAGSERIRGVRGGVRDESRVQEARCINVSLSALGNVVSALAAAAGDTTDRGSSVGSLTSSEVTAESGISTSASTHVPFRDSKLTRLLQDSLVGKRGCNTALIATISPSLDSQRETLSTLQFASRCMRVRTKAHIQRKESPADYAELYSKLQARLSSVERDFNYREHCIRRSYEMEIARLQALASSGGVTFNGNGVQPPPPPQSPGQEEMFYEMYLNFINLGQVFKSRLERQRQAIERLVCIDLSTEKQQALVSKIGCVETRLIAACNLVGQEHSQQEPLFHAIQAETGISKGMLHADQALLKFAQLGPKEPSARLARHAKVTSVMLKLECDAAHELLESIIKRFADSSRNEELESCTQALEYLLHSNSQLRNELENSSPAICYEHLQEKQPSPPPHHPPVASTTASMSQLDAFLQSANPENASVCS